MEAVAVEMKGGEKEGDNKQDKWLTQPKINN